MRRRVELFVVLFLLLFVCCSLAPQKQTGGDASDFSLESVGGATVSLSDYKGSDVILFFWTTWCPHCRKRLVDLNEKYEDMVASGIKLISIDVGESKSIAKRFRDKYSLAYPVLLDYNKRVAIEYGVIGVPTTILISKDGKILKSSTILPYNYKDLFK